MREVWNTGRLYNHGQVIIAEATLLNSRNYLVRFYDWSRLISGRFSATETAVRVAGLQSVVLNRYDTYDFDNDHAALTDLRPTEEELQEHML